MYAWIWRQLPGELGTKLLVAAGVLVVIGLILWYLVFPWAESKIQFDHGTVENGSTSGPATPGP